MVVDFTKEATELGAQPKQDYKLNIDLGDDAPPKAEGDGKPFDEAAKEVAAEQTQKKEDGAYHTAAKMMIKTENAIVPRISAMATKSDYRELTLDKDDEDTLIEMLAPVLEYHKFKPADPTAAFIGLYLVLRVWPVWDAWQKSRKQEQKAKAAKQENHAKGRDTANNDDDTPLSPADEVDDDGNIIKPAAKYFYKDGTPATGDIRTCKHKNCNNALKKKQQKFCSHSCKAYQQALDKVVDE